MTEPEHINAIVPRVIDELGLFDCAPLAARISARQCLINQGHAKGLRQFLGHGELQCCLDCDLGKQMVAYPPGGEG